MQFLTDWLTSYGNEGMLVAAFLAGSVVPFSSEMVMVALFAAGADPYQLVLYGTLGNSLGSMTNYVLGSFGCLDWLEKWFHIRPEQLRKAEKFAAGKGALTGFFCFLPVLGSALAVALGLAKANIPLTFLSITAGKFIRYWLLVFGVSHIITPLFG
ncbi:MAG: DedA family protein [Prevotella sp.]|nr:DedA family protein [Prevotella sp.]